LESEIKASERRIKNDILKVVFNENHIKIFRPFLVYLKNFIFKGFTNFRIGYSSGISYLEYNIILVLNNLLDFGFPYFGFFSVFNFTYKCYRYIIAIVCVKLWYETNSIAT